MTRPINYIKIIFLTSLMSIAACGGGGGGSTPTTGVTNTTLSGTAAAGAALIGTVTVKGALGVTRSAIIEANGNYNVDVTGLTAPYRLRAQGTVGGKTYKLHSYAEEADVGGNVNITPFTDLIIANVAGDIAEKFFDSTTQTSLDAAEVDAQEDALQAKLQDVLTALGVDSAINLLNSTFSADHSGLDAALDIVRVEIDSSTNIATITNLIENTSIQDSLAVPDDNTETLSVTDPGALTTAVSDTQAIADIFDAFTTAFATGLPQASAIEDFIHVDFLEEEQSKGLFLTDITTDPTVIGLTFTNISVFNINSAAGTANLHFSVSLNGINEIDAVESTDGWFAVKDTTSGLWQLLGDQRIVETHFSFHCNDNDGNGGNNGGCGINTRFFDDDFTNNGTVADAPIASGTVRIIDGSDATNVKGTIYLGTPGFTAPGDVQVYDEATGNFTGDFKGLGSALGQIDPSIFQAGDIIEHKLYTQELDTSTAASPQIAAGAVVVKTYTDTLLSVPSLTPKYPTADAATLAAISNFSLGNDLVLAWTLAEGTNNEEVLVEISDTNGNRFEIFNATLGNTTSSLTFSSTTLSATSASGAGLDPTATTYNLLVRIYSADTETGQSHSRDYTSQIPGPANTGGDSTNPPAINLTCGFSTPFDDIADQPSSFNSYNDFLTVLADCGGAVTTTEADIIGTWVEVSTDGSTETIVFNSGGSGTITSIENGQTFGPFSLSWSLSNNLVTTFFEGGAFMDIIAITSQNMSFYSEASDWTPPSDVSILDPTTLDGEVWVGNYTKQ